MSCEFDFGITSQEVKDYRTKHDVGLLTAHETIKREKMIEWLEKGGQAEPILLCLLKEGKL